MNLIECVKNLLSKDEYMDEFNGVHIDYTDNSNENTGLFLTSDNKLKEDVLGGMTRKATFTIYRNVYNATDSERIQNSTFILGLSAYLESLENTDIQFDYFIGKNEKRNAYITKIECSNGMLFKYLNGNPGMGAQYMLQLTVNYEVNPE